MTCERLLTSMNPFVFLHMSRLWKWFRTERTFVRPLASVNPLVSLHIPRLRKWFSTDRTFEWFFTGVNSFVALHIPRLWKWLRVERTFERLFTSVNLFVSLHSSQRWKWSFTLVHLWYRRFFSKNCEILWNKNSTLKNNWNTENDLNKSKAISNNNETGAMAKKLQISSERGTFLGGSADEELQKRDFNENKQDNPETCICLRPLKLILCPVCGYTTTGRLRKTCQVHPKDLYLLDVDACPRCKETNKCVFVEYDLTEGFK